MRYHLCCNQNLHCWEIRDGKEEIIFSGSLAEVNEYAKIHSLELR